MGSSYRELFKLYDLIQSGDLRSVEHFITNTPIQLNDILPCKGIGVLHLAVGIEPIEKSIECTEIILKNGGDPNLCNDDGVTPVHIAAIWGRVENLKLLIGCGGDPSQKDLDGHSAFDYAAREQQWDVFDYLHNVVDQIDDSLGSPVAYSLDLERILVTTDQLVAEYEPIIDNQPTNGIPTCRKSDMIRDWCEKSSLVMNKLYPTILGETFLIDDESAWRRNLTRNMTLDLTTDVNSNETNLNETCNTYKTCISNRCPVEISGIQRLEITSDESKVPTENSNDSLKRRLSVYENFSLPGSPNSITHRNYNSKSSLKKNQSKDTSSSELRRLNFDSSQSILTDESQEFDKVLAMAQNKTNEWISSSSRSSDCQITDVKACNTRRSSASSGVSSNFSGGSIVIANVQEEYKYEDKEESVILIEKRLLVSSVVLPFEDDVDSPDQTAASVASSLPSSVTYDNNTIRAELLKLGFQPGPINNSNRTLYLKKLRTLRRENHVGKTTQQQNLSGKTTQTKPTVKTTQQQNHVVKRTQQKPILTTQGTYSIELEKSLINDQWMKDLSPYIDLENKARADFSNPSQKWREGTSKTSFTYLLLDPRVTANLPARAGQQTNHVSWDTFVKSIFYVGKGKRSRPYSHLYQALTLWNKNFTSSNDKKVQHILDIWSDKVGVVCLHIFQNVIPAEAFTYEAAMIDVIGVQNLKNLKCGNYYGVVQSWPLKDRKMLGLYLLYRAMLIFLSEGERQLRPQDIE